MAMRNCKRRQGAAVWLHEPPEHRRGAAAPVCGLRRGRLGLLTGDAVHNNEGNQWQRIVHEELWGR